MQPNYFKVLRNSHIELNRVYFWTATIMNWRHLLHENKYKSIIVSSLEYLSTNNLIDVFAFVIMPNHIHLIWRLNSLNGKESPHASLLKFTAHNFKKTLLETDASGLDAYAVNASNKKYEFWQRDSLAIPLYTKKVALQKLNYIHNNPLAAHWSLVTEPADYSYSSALYYERDQLNFAFLKDLWKEF
jgi:putative transposase